jgi:acetyl-CoA synthetase
MPGPSVEDRIEQLSAIEAFSPPADFAAQAQVPDPGDYGRAAADRPAWWAEQARQRLDWHTPFSAVLDDSNPPFYSWFADGTLNVSHNCLDRHVLAGRGDRVAFHWRGEEGEERDLTYAELLRDIAEGREPGDVTTLRDASVLDALQYATSPGGTGT